MQHGNRKPKAPLPSLEQVKAEIEQRAKEIFIKRQKANGPGDELSDWLQAEKQVKAKYHLS